MNDIKLKTVEEFRRSQSDDCLPKGVRAMVVGNRIVFVHRAGGRWMPVPEKLQKDLEKKHIVVE